MEDGNQPFPLAFSGVRPVCKDSKVTDVTFAGLGIAEPILRALAQENYTQPTPIQTKRDPRSVGRPGPAGHRPDRYRQDGGLRFAPAAEAVDRPCPAPAPETKALILAPTRELAVQIEEALRTYGRFLNLKRAVILGGVNAERPGQHT